MRKKILSTLILRKKASSSWDTSETRSSSWPAYGSPLCYVVASVAKDCSIRLITNAKYYFMENNLFDESEHINISL